MQHDMHYTVVVVHALRCVQKSRSIPPSPPAAAFHILMLHHPTHAGQRSQDPQDILQKMQQASGLQDHPGLWRGTQASSMHVLHTLPRLCSHNIPLVPIQSIHSTRPVRHLCTHKASAVTTESSLVLVAKPSPCFTKRQRPPRRLCCGMLYMCVCISGICEQACCTPCTCPPKQIAMQHMQGCVDAGHQALQAL